MPTLQIIDVTMRSAVGEKNRSTDYKWDIKVLVLTNGNISLTDDNLCLHFIDVKMTTYQLRTNLRISWVSNYGSAL